MARARKPSEVFSLWNIHESLITCLFHINCIRKIVWLHVNRSNSIRRRVIKPSCGCNQFQLSVRLEIIDVFSANQKLIFACIWLTATILTCIKIFFGIFLPIAIVTDPPKMIAQCVKSLTWLVHLFRNY